MLPSSRTPRRRSATMPRLRRHLQGRRLPAAGDSVCPCCGAHAWVAGNPDYIARARVQIKTYIERLFGPLSRKRIRREHHGVPGIGHDRVPACARLDALDRPEMPLVGRVAWFCTWAASDGETDSPEFAHEVVAADKSILRDTEIDGRETLLIGVPVKRKKRVLGVIEIPPGATKPARIRRRLCPFREPNSRDCRGCEAVAS